MCAAATTLAIRAQNVPIDRQLEEMRHQIQQLKMENTHLKQKVEQLSKRKSNKQSMIHPTEENKREISLREKREDRPVRTRKWIEGSSLPPEDGELPTIQREIGETPLPPVGGGVSPIREVEMREISPPSEDGEFPGIFEIMKRVRKEQEEKDGRLEVEDEEMPFWDKAKNPCPLNRQEGRSISSGTLTIRVVRGNSE